MSQSRGCLIALALIAASPAAIAEERNKYVGIDVLYVLPDSARDASYGSGARLRVGVPFERVNLELNAQSYRMTHDTDSGRDPALGLGLDVLFPFGRENLAPFVLGGAGYLAEEIRGVREGGAYANLGLGAMLRVHEHVRLRGEARYVGVFSDAGAPNQDPLYDVHLSLGVQMDLTDAAPRGPVAPPPPADGDRDGVPDAIDRCPASAAGARVDAFGCARDTDGDGVPDAADRCPGTRRGEKVDASGCVQKVPPAPAPRADSDGDGVLDDADRCPGTLASLRVDAQGCVRVAQTLVIQGLSFDTGSDKLNAAGEASLRQAASSLKSQRDLFAEVAGHTDSVGKKQSNQALSQRRADAVRKYLVGQGVDAAQLRARGYGEDEPVADNGSPVGRGMNRRVELRVKGR